MNILLVSSNFKATEKTEFLKTYSFKPTKPTKSQNIIPDEIF